jgi:hypothetical protein
MIALLLHLYLLLFPRCELMVSWLSDFSHCNDSPAHAAACYAASEWDYSRNRDGRDAGDDPALMKFVFKLPFVRSVSCWR